jgi:hypothetical protein
MDLAVGYLPTTLAYNGALLAIIVWLFQARWRVAD